MANVIYTYGGGEALYKVLIGVQMIFKSGVTQDLTYLMTFVGISWAAFQGIQQNSLMPKLNWLAKYVLITSMFIVPTATLTVRDVVSKRPGKSIDGLPLGLVLPASIFSSIGFGITQLFDQAFTPVDNIPYTKYGQTFGAALISQARNFKIQDFVFRENLESFIDNCVIYDVMVGSKYNATELRDSTNIWELVSNNASNIRMFNYRDRVKSKGRTLVTCKEGTVKLEGYWKSDTEKLSERYANTIFGSALANNNNQTLGKAFIANIEVVSQLYGKNIGQQGAFETLKQIMIINAFADIPMSYGAVKAKQQQQESWFISGQLAREILPTLHAIFAALMYASFPLILGLLVLPSGLRTFGNYVGLLIWIETWPPLFAVLNLLANSASKLSGGNFTEITINNASQIISYNNNISAVANGMMMVLPYLSYNLLKGGAGQFVHLAGQIMGNSQGASMAASTEVTSGNRSLDNVSISNGQWFNNSGFKTDMNAAYRSGHREHQLSDGTIMKETIGGNTILQSGPGITHSVGATSMHMAVSNSSQEHQSLSYEKSQLAQRQHEYDTTVQTMQRQAIELVDRLAAGEASGEHYSYNHATGAGKILNSAIAESKELHDSHAYNNSQALEGTIKGNIGGSFNKSFGSAASSEEKVPQGILKRITGGIGSAANIGLDFSATGKADNMNIQGLTENKGSSINTNVTKQTEDIARAAKDIQFNETQTHEKALADSLSGSYEHMQQLRNSINVSEQNIQRFQTSSDSSQSHSLTVSDDIYHKRLEIIANQRDKSGFKIGLRGAQKIIEERGDDYQQDDQAFYASSRSHQQVQKPKFDYNKLKEDYLSQNIDIKKDYTEVAEVGNSVMEASRAVTPEAKEMVAPQYKSAPNKIKSAEDKILRSGNQLQKTLDKEEDGGSRHGYSPGRDKVIGKKFTEY